MAETLNSSSCTDVVPRRPLEFRVRSGVDGVPLLVGFAHGILKVAIGGVPTSDMVQAVALHLSGKPSESGRALIDVRALTSLSFAERTAIAQPR